MDNAVESGKLLDELEKIYLSGVWRADAGKVIRVAEIKSRLGELLKEVRNEH